MTVKPGSGTLWRAIDQVVAVNQFSKLNEGCFIHGYSMEEIDRPKFADPERILPKAVLFPRGESDLALTVLEWEISQPEVSLIRERLRTAIHPCIESSGSGASQLIAWNLATWPLHEMLTRSIVQALVETESGIRLYSIVGSLATIESDLVDVAHHLPVIGEILWYFEVPGRSPKSDGLAGRRKLEESGFPLRFTVPDQLGGMCRQWDTRAVLLPDGPYPLKESDNERRRIHISNSSYLTTLNMFRYDHEVVIAERVNRRTGERRTRVFEGVCAAYLVILQMFSDEILVSGGTGRGPVQTDFSDVVAEHETGETKLQFSFDRAGVAHTIVMDGSQTFAQRDSGSLIREPMTPLSFICALLGSVYE